MTGPGIFLCALLLRAGLALAAFLLAPERLVGGATTYGGDGMQYDALAANLLHHGVLSLDGAPPYAPSMYRPPGYPALLAAIYAVFGHAPRWAVLCQLLLGAASCVVLYRLTTAITGDWRKGALAGLLLACDPGAMVASLELWSETLFVLLLLLHLQAFWAGATRDEPGALLAAGAWLGLAALVRPEAAGLLPLEAPLAFAWTGRPWRLAAGRVLALSLPACLLLAPWAARNYRLFGVPGLSAASGYTLLFEDALLVESAGRGVPREQVRQEYRRRLGVYARERGLDPNDHARLQPEYRRMAVVALAARPGTYLAQQAKATPALWVPHVPGLMRVLGYGRLPFTERWEALRTRGWSGVWAASRGTLGAAPWLLLAVAAAWCAFQLAIYVYALAGAWWLGRTGRWRALALLALPVLYFGVVTQLAVLSKTPRHLAPVLPCLMAAAAAGWLRREAPAS